MSEVRLIDKGALIRKMLEVLEEGWGYQELFDAVENAPTIDPVKHGRWEPVFDNNGLHHICSLCGEWRYHSKQIFCGFCGAKNECGEGEENG